MSTPPTVPRHRAPLLILIPACNESERIQPVLRGIEGLGLDADVLVIDDGSDDDTIEQARTMGARVVSHPHNLGYGSALLTGYVYAKRHNYERLVQLDADGQHDPRSIPTLLQALDANADVVVGSRYLEGRAPPTSFLRRVGSRMFSWIVTTWTRTKITDPTSGFQAMSRRAIHALAHDGFPDDYPDADVLITVFRTGLTLREVPVQMYPRVGGVSMHRGGRAAYYAYKMMLTLTLLPVRRRSPYRDQRQPPPLVPTDPAGNPADDSAGAKRAHAG